MRSRRFQPTLAGRDHLCACVQDLVDRVDGRHNLVEHKEDLAFHAETQDRPPAHQPVLLRLRKATVIAQIRELRKEADGRKPTKGQPDGNGECFAARLARGDVGAAGGCVVDALAGVRSIARHAVDSGQPWGAAEPRFFGFGLELPPNRGGWAGARVRAAATGRAFGANGRIAGTVHGSVGAPPDIECGRAAPVVAALDGDGCQRGAGRRAV